MNPPDRLRRPPDYLLSVLRDGALPFQYRSGVRSLLGIPDTAPGGAAPTAVAPVHFAYATPAMPLDWPPAVLLASATDRLPTMEVQDAPPPGPPAPPRPDPVEPGRPLAASMRDLQPPSGPAEEILAAPRDAELRPPEVDPLPRLHSSGAPHASEPTHTSSPSRETMRDDDAPPALPVDRTSREQQAVELLPREGATDRPLSMPAASPQPMDEVQQVRLQIPGVSERPSRFPPLQPVEPPEDNAAAVEDAEVERRRATDPLRRPAPPTPQLAESTPALQPGTIRDVGVSQLDGSVQRRAAAIQAALVQSMEPVPPHVASAASPARAPAADTPAPDEELRPAADTAALLARIRSAVQTLAARDATPPAATVEESGLTPPAVPPPAPPVVLPQRPLWHTPLPPAYWERRLGHIRARILR